MRHAWFLCAGLILLVSPAGRGVPVISPSGSDVVVSEGDRLELRCRDKDDDSLALQWVRRKGRRVEAELEMGGASVIRITTVQQQHMGQYTCQNTHTNQTTSIYVYVKDLQNAFVRSMVSEVLVREGDDGTLSCLVTDPAVSHVTLQSCDGSALPVDLRFASHPHTGVTISNVSTHFQGCYVCVGQRERARVSSIQYNLIVRPVPESAPVIRLSSENTVFLIQNQQLHLSCSSINVNHDLQLNWSLPHAAVALESRSTYILPGHQGYERFVKLNIRSVKMSDSGVYRCSAKNERGVSMATVNLEVYEQGFINMTETDGRVLEVREGDSLTLRALMTSHPPPSSLTWSYNNQQLHNTSEHLITLHTHHYRFVSALRLVRVHSSEGGVYTLSANHSDASANLSFTVHVICKPLIVSQEGPVDGLVRCVASGCPVPEISWYYCKTPSTRCSQLLNSTRAAEDEVSLVKVSGFRFGRSEVESRLKVHGGRFHALECVASTRGEQAYTLFSISDRPLQHQLFTPLFSSVVCTSVLLVLLLLLLLYKYLQKPKYQIHWKVIDSFDGNNYIYIDPSQLPYDPRWEFPRERLRFGRTLGAGAFGRVVSATAYGLSSPDTVSTVAVKMLKPSAHSTEKEALMSELKVLSYIGHHVNIVNLLGACTVSGPTLVITEYCCYGDLLNYMRRKRQEFNSSETEDGYYKNMLSQNQPSSEENDNGYVPMTSYQKRSSQAEWSDEKDDLSLNTEDLLSFSYQVARGMDFLSSKHCVHRDLAARNILLTQGRLAKICDFGLARDITTDSSYVLRGNARLPVKWMSPESLFTCVYSYESDVWSYGILLWEIFSLGNTPYPGIPVGSRFYKMIQDGYRMSEPEFAPCEVYEVMRWCWSSDPLKRPTFQKLVERTELLLSETTRHEYLNLSGISEATLPPGQQRAERLSSTASTRPLLRTTSRSLLEPSSV